MGLQIIKTNWIFAKYKYYWFKKYQYILELYFKSNTQTIKLHLKYTKYDWTYKYWMFLKNCIKKQIYEISRY